ncbi:hypothetical protein ACVI1K_007827 [Bradyrhizobium sp. USDA 4508]
MPSHAVPSSNTCWPTLAFSSTPILSKGPSGHKRVRETNCAFAGRDDGGQTWAAIATLLQTAKMNNVNPFDWHAVKRQRIANGWPSSEIDALTPLNYAN